MAKLFGKQLPGFKNQAEAEAQLFADRDRRLENLLEAAAKTESFDADFTPESLKRLELWYFELWEGDGFGAIGLPREEFECSMAMYFLEVAVRNCPRAEWEVSEYGFENGKYEIGVKNGLHHLMRSRMTDHFQQPNNKRRQKIYREYMDSYGARWH